MAVGANRMLGGIGALLLVVSVVGPLLALPRLFDLYSTGAGAASPFLSVLGLAGLAGIILFMIAMKGFAGDYKDAGIFNNALYGLLSSIVVGVLAGVFMVAIIFMNLSSVIPTFNPVPGPTDLFQSILSYMVPVMPVFSVAGLVQALFIMRAFNLLAVKSEVRLFRTAGWALVAGSVLALILACVGVLLFFAALVSAASVLVIPFAGTTVSYLAWIFGAKAFFSIKAPTNQPLPASPAAGQVKYCPHCEAANLPDAVFCTRCGKKL
jgi:uncharacterized membrane protein